MKPAWHSEDKGTIRARLVFSILSSASSPLIIVGTGSGRLTEPTPYKVSFSTGTRWLQEENTTNVKGRCYALSNAAGPRLVTIGLKSQTAGQR